MGRILGLFKMTFELYHLVAMSLTVYELQFPYWKSERNNTYAPCLTGFYEENALQF